MATTTRQARTVRRVTAGPRYANRPAMRAEERGETALQPSDGRFRERTRVRAHAWDAGIFFSVMLLLAIGLVALFSASYSTGYYNFKGDSLHFVTRQGMVAVAGVVAMIVISKVSYKLYARFYKPFLAVSVVCLLAYYVALAPVL